MKKLTIEEFIEKAQKSHGNKYDYSKSNYITARDKIQITCLIHGDFWQKAISHCMSGAGCIKCGHEKVSRDLTTPQDDFVKRCIDRHGDRYDYSQLKYKNSNTKIKIKCREHGIFHQLPFDHLKGKGCTKCSVVKNGLNLRMGDKDFIEKSILKHGDKYDYSKVNYINNSTKVNIICKFHGIFKQIPSVHLRGCGCPTCTNIISKPEIDIQNFVMEITKFSVITSDRNLISPKELDIYIPFLNKAIEFNGWYWHYDHSNPKCKPKGYHAMKSNLCREKGIRLLHIREDLWIKNPEKMKQVIQNFLEK